jgi:hypothetical protein
MWYGGGMEKIGWTDRVSNEVLQTVKGERKILQLIKREQANWIGHRCIVTDLYINRFLKER